MSAKLYVPTPETKEMVRSLHARGRLVRVRRGWYASAGAAAGTGPVDPWAAAEAGTGPVGVAEVAAAAARIDAVASHATAAALWGIPVLGRPDPQVHLTRVRRQQGTVRAYPGVVLHHASLPPDQLTVCNGVPVTTPARTVLDLARTQRFRGGVVPADAALRQGRCTRQELVGVLAACRGWPGTRRARRAVEFADPRSESPLESISRVAFHEYGLPAPILQAVIGGYERADFLWSQWRVIGEADGMGKYTDPEVLRHEKMREESIVQLGFTMFRWTWQDAFFRPDALAYRAEQVLIRNGYQP